MKIATRKTPNRWATVSSNRAPGAAGQNTSCSITWAAKQEKFQPAEECFFLTSPFIELTRHLRGAEPTCERYLLGSSWAAHSEPVTRLNGISGPFVAMRISVWSELTCGLLFSGGSLGSCSTSAPSENSYRLCVDLTGSDRKNTFLSRVNSTNAGKRSGISAGNTGRTPG
jgi:hypothetical protein